MLGLLYFDVMRTFFAFVGDLVDLVVHPNEVSQYAAFICCQVCNNSLLKSSHVWTENPRTVLLYLLSFPFFFAGWGGLIGLVY